MGWLTDLLRTADAAPVRRPLSKVDPLTSPVYREVDAATAVRPVVGRCDQIGHMYDRSGECIYCGPSLFDEGEHQ